MDFQRGDIVKEKGGTVSMTATGTYDVPFPHGTPIDRVPCKWFAGTKLQSENFRVKDLELVQRRTAPVPDHFRSPVKLASGGPNMEVTYDRPRDFDHGGRIRIVRCEWKAGRSTEKHDFAPELLVNA